MQVWHILKTSTTQLTTVWSASGTNASGNAPILSFSGDAEDQEGGEDPVIDIFAQAAQEVDDESDNEEVDDAEPEDDFNAAWEVLDLARAIYDKQKDEVDDEEVKLKLADTYIALGDVSLETGEGATTIFSSSTLISFRKIRPSHNGL